MAKICLKIYSPCSNIAKLLHIRRIANKISYFKCDCPASVRAVIRKDSLVLIEWFAPKSISFLPGGALEAGEDLKIALCRELAEELTDARFTVIKYLGRIGHTWRTSDGLASCLSHFFETDLIEDPVVTAREQGREIRWLDLNSSELGSLQPPSLRNCLLQGHSSGKEWNILDSEP